MVKINLTIFLMLFFYQSLLSQTYPIKEPDVVEEVLERKEVILKKIEAYKKESLEKIEQLRGAYLTSADKNTTYYIDPSYTLKEEMIRVDEFGNKIGVIYPKGFTFNPLEYTKIAPPPMIIFNPCNDKESLYVKKIIKEDSYALLVSSGCPLSSVKWQDFGVSISILTNELKEKLKLKNTISIATADMEKKRIRVDVLTP